MINFYMLKYFTFFALFYNTAFANHIIKIIDGDTIYFTKNNEIIKVRLQCADTPECGKSCGKKGQSQYINNIDIGFESYNFTKNWLMQHSKQIDIHCKNKDKYNRSVCYVIADNQNLNHLLIQEGYAVADKKYCNKEELQMMEVAKQNKKGLWALGWVEMPSEFRHKK